MIIPEHHGGLKIMYVSIKEIDNDRALLDQTTVLVNHWIEGVAKQTNLVLQEINLALATNSLLLVNPNPWQSLLNRHGPQQALATSVPID